VAGPVLSWEAVKKSLQRHKQQGRKIVFTNGCFDLLHAGHLKVFRWAKRQGDVLVVGLNSDASVRRLKGPIRPLIKQNERAELLAALEPVDAVVVFSQDTPKALIALIQPDVLVKGGDWAKADIVGADVAKKVVRVPLMKGRSTTNLIKRIVAAYAR
jgi:rfaE bifunctional protein nucleotidyltransferase chain/domain